MKKDVNKDALWVVDYLDPVGYHDHGFHTKNLSHSKCFKYLLMLGQNQLHLRVIFLCGVVHNLDSIKLGDNIWVDFL